MTYATETMLYDTAHFLQINVRFCRTLECCLGLHFSVVGDKFCCSGGMKSDPLLPADEPIVPASEERGICSSSELINFPGKK
jgi:hypothetical protein